MVQALRLIVDVRRLLSPVGSELCRQLTEANKVQALG